ncbi:MULTISPECIES: alpha/beta hydrolase [unclassified Agrococcus]|uniref:alpha/beta hydrolase n=1 Tax=unclassified Agrococcus TaxID=2615065 RepID=UPI00362204CC
MARASRLLLGGIAVGAAAAVGAHAARVRAATAAVDPQYRTPWLLVPDAAIGARIVALSRRMRAKAAPIADGVVAEGRLVAGRDGRRVPVWVYEPERTGERPLPVLLYVHGGGFVLGDPVTYHDRCSSLAADLGIRVVSVDYRLAPEDPFPAALDDCVDVLRWIHASAHAEGVDGTRVAVGGDSAGGGLAACAVQAGVDEGLPIAFQLLLYPMLDDRTVTREDHAGTGRFVWSTGSNRHGWTSYLGVAPGGDAVPPYAVAARREGLAGLPPTWIGVGALDLFVEEDIVYARRLRDAGVDVTLVEVPGAFHAFERIVPDAPGSRIFERRMRAALRAALGLPQQRGRRGVGGAV